MGKSEVHFKQEREIEQRYAVNPNNGLLLPKKYLEYHQADVRSGDVSKVIEEFTHRTARILGGYKNEKWQISSLLSTLDQNKPLKIRVRRIIDPSDSSIRAEFTTKQNTDNTRFKKNDERNLTIDEGLAGELIKCIAPALKVPGNEEYEYGVMKKRYRPAGPDRKLWDLDIYTGLNTDLYTAEIELDGINEQFVCPEWTGDRMNGIEKYKPFGTGELQKVPFQLMSDKLKGRFFQAQRKKI